LADIEALADLILGASDGASSIPPITDGDPAFDLKAAYAVSAAITRRRIARGERPVGWKIGFTNRTIWDQYDVHAPIWGPVYDTTVRDVPFNETIECGLASLVEPRIEPEIVFRIAQSPAPGVEGEVLFGCLDGVAHGYEIVQSIYPGWRFKPADTVAAFGLHGRLFHGPFATVTGPDARDEWPPRLADFEIILSCDSVEVDRGHGRNVLDGPLFALAYFIRELDKMTGERLKPGDVVTTGTVTKAFPVKAGETWSTRLLRIPLPGLTIEFS
jgi:2-oxo-3-hexenedioate decarboxylase